MLRSVYYRCCCTRYMSITEPEMDKSDRKRIADNAEVLKEMISYEKLLPKLRESGIFNSEMLHDIHMYGPTDSERMKEMLRCLPKRGPKAYEDFIKCLTTTEQWEAASLLVNDLNPSTSDGKNLRSSLSFTGSNSDTYPMKRRPRGVAFILSFIEFNNLEYREGGEVDVNVLEKLFRSLYFEVEIHHNLSKEDAVRVVTSFKDDPRHITADCAIICCLSHGVPDGFYCSDHQVLKTEWLLAQFNNENCKYLQSKPKVFFLQHCRGRDFDYAIPNEGDSKWLADSNVQQEPIYIFHNQEAASKSLATWSDMKICYSTSKNKLSYRSPELGTFFIYTIDRVFSYRAHDTHLDDMLKDVTNRMLKKELNGGMMQSTEICDLGWRKNLYFNPKKWEAG